MEPAIEVRCDCGWLLIDGLEDTAITVGACRFPWRRSTDYVLCPACGASHRVADVRVVVRSGR